jgi:hypothetical protein
MKTRRATFSFNKRYFYWSLLLLAAEAFIALYVDDQIIRPYGGDFLVVILMYCILRCSTRISVNKICIAVLLFSYFIETLQYFHFADKLGFKPGSIFYILLGNYFAWTDIVSYTLGIATILLIERIISYPELQRKHS